MKRQRRMISVLLSVVLLVVLVGLSLPVQGGDLDAWMMEAQVGPYTPQEEDWDAVYEKAKQEGEVVIYASTSRIFDGAESFERAYPGITVEAYNLSGVEIVEKLEREWAAGIRNVDIIMTSDVARGLEQMIDEGMIVNYVPPELVPVISERFREPILCHRFGSTVWAYSSIAYDEAPVSNIWELTLPEWKNKVVVRDPMRSGGTMMTFVDWVGNADKLAEAYEEFFGKPIELTTPNAGYELIKRLLDNGLQLAPGSREVNTAVSQHDIPNPPIGQVTSSKYRDVIEGRENFEIIWEMEPTSGYAYLTRMPIVGFAPHPNAAKLLILHLVGGLDGMGEGYDPWRVPGNFPVRDDIPTPEPFKHHSEYDYWYEDLGVIEEHVVDVMDFWLQHVM